VALGDDMRQTIGCLNPAEFFATFASTAMSVFTLGLYDGPISVGPAPGGMIGARAGKPR
jgi:uncharacterized membrane protein YfcA